MRWRGSATADPPASPWTGGRWTWLRTPDRRLLVLSILLQLALAVALGHSRDTRMFMSAGYLVGTGHTPYVSQDLTTVFHHVTFKMLSTIGYPPPWPLLLGGIYRATYALVPDFYLYNLAIKLPVIAANAGLAYLAGATLQNLGAAPAVIRRAWLALLFNPFVLYVGAAWGQIDAIVAVLALAALLLVAAGRRDLSAVLLALAVCVKPTAAPMLVAVLLVIGAGSLPRALRYAGIFAAGVFAFYVLPFFVFGWDASPLLQANAQLSMAGSMSPATIVRLVRGPLVIEGRWWLLGLLWIPALAVIVALARKGRRDFIGLLTLSLVFTLVFFLTRAWLAEPNVVLLLAPMLVLAALGRVGRRLFTALWAIPLVFTVINASPLQLLWVAAPGAMARSLAWWTSYGDLTLAARAALVVAWQVAGWWTVAVCLRRQRLSAEESGVAGADEAAGANGPADARDPADASGLGGRRREALP
jgi:hypothetical protein